MAAKPHNNDLDSTATDEGAADEADSSTDTPFADPLAALFGVTSDAEDEAENEAEDDEDDESADTEADAEEEDSDDDEESDEGDSDEAGEEEGEEEESDEEEGSEKDEANDGDAAWKAQFNKLPPEAQKMVKGMRHAIEGLREKRNELRDKLEKTESDLKTAKAAVEEQAKQAPRIVPTDTDPLSDLDSEAEVTAYISKAQSTVAWCEDHEDGAEVSDGKGGKTELSKEQIRNIRRNAEAMVNKYGPARLAWLSNFTKAHATVEKAYPKLLQDPETKQAAAALLKEYPELQRNAGYEIAIGDMLMGRRVREGKLITVKPGKPKETPSTKDKEKAKAQEKKKAPSASLSASASVPAGKTQSKSKAPSIDTLRKDVRAGKGDPLAFMMAASARK